VTHPIFIIGATGNVGEQVARSLAGGGFPIRLGDFDLPRLRARFPDQSDLVRFDFADSSTYAPAFGGVKKIFLLRPPHITDVKRLMLPAIDAAQAAGVEHIVFLSLIGIENNTRVPHYPVEQHLLSCGLNYTFLRASFFMQNLNTQHREEIRTRGEIDVPVGRGRTSFIDVRDIGAVAALALTQPGHDRKAYDLTGAEALDYYQVAEIFTRILGRTIRYRDPSTAGFLLRRLRSGTPLPFALVMAMLYSSTRRGMADLVTGEVSRLLGRSPISLAQYVQDYRASWE
jgi:uncharacterized protein YbjT (DUF2867 family)